MLRWIASVFDISICLFLEAKTLEGLIDRQHCYLHHRCASLGHVDAYEAVA
jgi:hypothetical protein